jgi:hypothetical protein
MVALKERRAPFSADLERAAARLSQAVDSPF